MMLKMIFGDDACKLPRVFHLHYANRPYSMDIVRMVGNIYIRSHWFLRCFAPVMRWLSVDIVRCCEGAVLMLSFESKPHSDIIHLNRLFDFGGGIEEELSSEWQILEHGKIIEWMNPFLGLVYQASISHGKIVINSDRCMFKLGKLRFSLPIAWILKVHAEEIVRGERSFSLQMRMDNSILGAVYFYSGEFTIL